MPATDAYKSLPQDPVYVVGSVEYHICLIATKGEPEKDKLGWWTQTFDCPNGMSGILTFEGAGFKQGERVLVGNENGTIIFSMAMHKKWLKERELSAPPPEQILVTDLDLV